MFRLGLEVSYRGDVSYKQFEMAEGGKIFLGRQDCDLLLVDRTVSRRHLGFAVKDGRLVAGDLKSSHGTRHNGRVLKQALAREGDLFELGSYRIRVVEFGRLRARSRARRRPEGALAIPMLSPGAGGPRAFLDFYRELLRDGRHVWDRIPTAFPTRLLALTLVRYALLGAVLQLVLRVLLIGMAPGSLAVGIVSVVEGLAAFTVAAFAQRMVVAPLLGAHTDWPRHLVVLIVVAATWLPAFTLSQGAVYFGWPGLGLVIMVLHLGFYLWGLVKLTEPARIKGVVYAAAGLALLVALTVSGVLNRSSRRLASLPATRAFDPVTGTMAGAALPGWATPRETEPRR